MFLLRFHENSSTSLAMSTAVVPRHDSVTASFPRICQYELYLGEASPEMFLLEQRKFSYAFEVDWNAEIEVLDSTTLRRMTSLVSMHH